MDKEPLLGALDGTALLWVLIWSLMVSIYRAASAALTRKRPLWYVAVEALLGGVPGGVLAGTLAMERGAKTRGMLALAAMFGASIGPYIAGWMVFVAPQVLPELLRRLSGLKLTLPPPGDQGGTDENDDK